MATSWRRWTESKSSPAASRFCDACQFVISPVKALLALEWLQPGEGEDTAAPRLLNKPPEAYGPPI
jgi:hypothetical protein